MLRKTLATTYLCLAASQAFGAYNCQLASMPGPFVTTVRWDGSVPADLSMEFDGAPTTVHIQSIGLAGHPELLFSIATGDRTLFAASQAQDLTDYNLTWRSDTRTDAMISVACRRSPL